MHNILETFDKVYLINLKKRPERLKKWFEDNNAIVKDLTNFKVIDAVDGASLMNTSWEFSLGALGCLESHLKILKDAKENNYTSIFIFEDDSVCTENFLQKFEIGFSELPTNWDMLYLYANHFDEPQPYSDHLNKSSAVLCTVAYAIHSKVFDLLIHVLELKIREVDVVFAHMHFLIHAYNFKENICIQADGFSDIQNAETRYYRNNNVSILKKCYRFTRNILLKKIIKQ